jgi:hypothetical protein
MRLLLNMAAFRSSDCGGEQTLEEARDRGGDGSSWGLAVTPRDRISMLPGSRATGDTQQFSVST